MCINTLWLDVVIMLTVYNHWTGLEWTTGLLLESKVQHYISILGLPDVIAEVLDNSYMQAAWSLQIYKFEGPCL